MDLFSFVFIWQFHKPIGSQKGKRVRRGLQASASSHVCSGPGLGTERACRELGPANRPCRSHRAALGLATPLRAFESDREDLNMPVGRQRAKQLEDKAWHSSWNPDCGRLGEVTGTSEQLASARAALS